MKKSLILFLLFLISGFDNYLYSSQNNAHYGNESTDCIICMETYKNNDKIIVLPCNNNHFMHQHCFNQFVENEKAKSTNPMCPICRAIIPYYDKVNNHGQIQSSIANNKGGIKNKIYLINNHQKQNTKQNNNHDNQKQNQTKQNKPKIDITKEYIKPLINNIENHKSSILEFLASTTLGLFARTIIKQNNDKPNHNHSLKWLSLIGLGASQCYLLNNINQNRFENNNRKKTIGANLSGLLFGGLIVPTFLDLWSGKQNEN